MSNQSNSRVNWLHVGIAAMLGAALALVFQALNGQISPAPIVINPVPTIAPLPTAEPEPLTVFINGAVSAAGLYELPAGSRVQDVIDAAGGFSADSYQDNINLAAPLSDGMQLYISTTEQAKLAQRELLENPLQSADSPTQASTQTGVTTAGLININTATRDELETIPSVGPATAENIMRYREDNGAFATIEEIMNVQGIGEGKFEDMQEFITVENE